MLNLSFADNFVPGPNKVCLCVLLAGEMGTHPKPKPTYSYLCILIIRCKWASFIFTLGRLYSKNIKCKCKSKLNLSQHFVGKKTQIITQPKTIDSTVMKPPSGMQLKPKTGSNGPLDLGKNSSLIEKPLYTIQITMQPLIRQQPRPNNTETYDYIMQPSARRQMRPNDTETMTRKL